MVGEVNLRGWGAAASARVVSRSPPILNQNFLLLFPLMFYSASISFLLTLFFFMIFLGIDVVDCDSFANPLNFGSYRALKIGIEVELKLNLEFFPHKNCG